MEFFELIELDDNFYKLIINAKEYDFIPHLIGMFDGE